MSALSLWQASLERYALKGQWNGSLVKPVTALSVADKAARESDSSVYDRL